MMSGKCGGFIDSAQETLVLAFKVAESTLLDSPEMIERILKNPAVQNAIQTAATTQARALVQKQQKGQTVTSGDVGTGAKAVVKAGGGVLQTAGLKELEETAKGSKEYKKLQKSLKELECSWKQSPVGVFVDRNKGWLYVVGVGLALSGAVVMYRFKAGDMIAGPVSSLGTKLLKFKVLGNVEIAAKDIRFVPSKREVGTKMLVTAKWKQVKVTFEAGVTLQGTTVTQANGRAEVVVKVTKGLTLNARGAYQYQATSPDAPWKNTQQYDLGLGMNYKNAFGSSRLSITAMMFATQDATVTKYGGKAGVNLRLTGKPSTGGLNLKLDAAANKKTTLVPIDSGSTRQSQNEVTGTLGISLNF
jgi:hypothetical protein